MNNLGDIERALAILLNEEENEIGAVSLHELAVFVNRYGISRDDLEKWLAIAKMRGKIETAQIGGNFYITLTSN